PAQKEHNISKDLRGAFISAINAFADTAFNSNSIEYLESGNILFIFKIAEVQSGDNTMLESLIIYGLVDKSKKKSDKLVKKFFGKVDPMLQLFIQKYNGVNFSEVNQFSSFGKIVEEFFIKK
ncbi:hypothetical protein LCGC14_1352020, partial [marine sediment metagenome]